METVELALPLETERLVLRLFTAADLNALHSYQSRPDVARFLYSDPRTAFDMLTVVTGIHYVDRDYDYEVLYHLLSLPKNHRLRLKVRLREGETVPSVTPVWPGADWPERETYDLVGVRFSGHPDLRRIIMPEDYPDHPLRKDFDVEGGPAALDAPGRPASPGFRDMERI